MRKNKLEQQAHRLWQTYVPDSEDKFWAKYIPLLNKAKDRKTVVIQPTHIASSPATAKQVPLTFFAKKNYLIFGTLCVLLLFALVAVGLNKYWYGVPSFANYSAYSSFKTYYSSVKSDKMLLTWHKLEQLKLHKKKITSALGVYEEKHRVTFGKYATALGTIGKRTRKDKYATVLDMLEKRIRNGKRKVDSLDLLLEQQRKVQAEVCREHSDRLNLIEKEKDALFGTDFTPTQLRKLDTLHQYSQKYRFEITKESIEHFLASGGGIDWNKKPENLDKKNIKAYDLFMPGDTTIYFTKNAHRLYRVRQVYGDYYGLYEDGYVAKVDTDHRSIYKASIQLIYQGRVVTMQPEGGLSYETKRTKYNIPQRQRKHIKTRLLISKCQTF